ncbi:DNA polymerase III subunit gamma/tau [Natronincola ferrireducens]|uniref:DNA-directed DNA polymerase n=1 Tax=Natronincola ferrireducens TaxID=393762 RepID=A0A1G9HPI6_9FIRM|nr:DNA polymerase III subunit gamma/tau [Natronincola ferrireducens]SDL14907.1 DNA polymerase-3 subunit gamma/tau [Natronincola ferrireducens]
MTYKALYRRFRPQVFEDVIGQGAVTTTLKNQIKTSNVSHAYLFSGTRGTGKTSTAKIFARAINCLNPENFNPCNLCEVCKGILTESIMDVIEIDAASNNGVDHIRELRENVKYPPSKGRYKVYIIDEVHMLSSGAFNALLKTLEEPPDHIIFILATTDPQKLPATILSRCQRFDFKPVTTKDMIERLRDICERIGTTADEEALTTIALNAGGALRDALSILEQCIAFSSDNLTYEDVIDTLGIINHELLFHLGQCIGEKKVSEAIYAIQKIMEEGKDIQQLIKDLIHHFRNLMMVKMEVDLEELSGLSQEILDKLKDQSKAFDVSSITEAIHLLSETEAKAKYAPQPRILLEVAIVTLCQEKEETSFEGLLQRIKKLEETIQTGEFIRKAIKQRPSKEIGSIKKEEEPGLAVKDKEKIESLEEVVLEEKKELLKENQATSIPLDFSEIKEKWEEIKAFIRKDKKAQIEAMLREGELEDIIRGSLVISFKDGFGFHRETLDREKTKEYIATVIEKITGQKLKLNLVMEYELGKKEEKDSREEILVEKLKKTVPEGILEIYDE